MSKFSTIDVLSHRVAPQTYEESKLHINQQVQRATMRDRHISPVISANNNVILVKLPFKNNENNNQFLTSLYDTSLKRLKKQRSSLLKQLDIPSISLKKYISDSAQARYNVKQPLKKLAKSYEFPEAKVSIPKAIARHANYLSFIQQKHEQTQKLLEQYINKEDFSKNQNLQRNPQLNETSVFCFKNLKEKYLTLHQNSLTNRKCSEKNHSRSAMESYSFNKNINDHVEKYKKKREEDTVASYQHSFFKARLHSNNSIVFPKNRTIIVKFGDERLPRLQGEDVSSFIKRKELNHPSLNQTKPEHLQKRHKCRYRAPLSTNQRKDEQQFVPKIQDFTPWETQLINYD